ncbi:hypothetical protein [Vibrio mediterranei]|uniref:hypothetical protein n=1 Tax=Vibrio mediterranei TaxID=689 RepID=UPI004067CEC4
MNAVAYASNAITLDDYFRSDVCSGKSIYCAFEIDEGSMEASYIIRKMNMLAIERIEFQNGLTLFPDGFVSKQNATTRSFVIVEGEKRSA